MMTRSKSKPGRSNGEEGWALLGLILALAILGIALTSSVVPNVQFQVKRDKEAELIYRGHVMAEAIARYYNLGNRGAPVQLVTQMPYGYLTDLKKLRDGVISGANEIKFVRGSAIIDPMTGDEWEPVYVRDPRIMKVLQAYAAANQVPIPIQLLSIAGPPGRSGVFGQATSNFPNSNQNGQTGTVTVTKPNDNGEKENDPEDEDDDEDEEDDDEDEDDEIDEDNGSGTANDPLAHLFQGGATNLPIVGVAPKLKGTAIRTLYGLTNYEEWVFIYVPPPGIRNNRLR